MPPAVWASGGAAWQAARYYPEARVLDDVVSMPFVLGLVEGPWVDIVDKVGGQALAATASEAGSATTGALAGR